MLARNDSEYFTYINSDSLHFNLGHIYFYHSFYREGNGGIASRWICFSKSPPGSSPGFCPWLSISCQRLCAWLWEKCVMPCLLQNSPRGWGREGMDSVQHTRQECLLHRVAISIVNLIEEWKLGVSFVNRDIGVWPWRLSMLKHISPQH